MGLTVMAFLMRRSLTAFQGIAARSQAGFVGTRAMCTHDEVLKGSVRWFDERKGFCFLMHDEAEKDIFVHFSAIRTDSPFKTLKMETVSPSALRTLPAGSR